MPRPCAAAHPAPIPERCHLCLLSRTRPDYARLWGEPWPPPGAANLDSGPGWWRRAVAFTGAAVRHAWNGLPATPTPEQERRLALCLACEQLDQDTGACKKCGCGVRKKTGWLGEHCPLARW